MRNSGPSAVGLPGNNCCRLHDLALASGFVSRQVTLFVLRTAAAPTRLVATRTFVLADRFLSMRVVVIVVAVGTVYVLVFAVAAHGRSIAVRGLASSSLP